MKPPAQSHSTTSVDAAVEIKPEAPRLRGQVLRFLQAAPDGATDQEMQELLSMNPSTQRPRRIELVQRHLVRDSGRKRKTPSGRNATVWEATTNETSSFDREPSDSSAREQLRTSS